MWMRHDRYRASGRERRSAWPALGIATGLILLSGCGVSSVGAGTPGSGSGANTVTMTTDKTSYVPGDAIVVTITNGLTTSILVPDHQTNCSIVSLELSVGGSWQRQNPCKLMSATRLIEIRASQVSTQQLTPSSSEGASGWPAGTYRVALEYRLTPTGDSTSVPAVTITVK